MASHIVPLYPALQSSAKFTRLFNASLRCPNMPKLPCDGAISIGFITVSGPSASKTISEPSPKRHTNQPHAPRPTAVLLSCRQSKTENAPAILRHDAIIKMKNADSYQSSNVFENHPRKWVNCIKLMARECDQ